METPTASVHLTRKRQLILVSIEREQKMPPYRHPCKMLINFEKRF